MKLGELLFRARSYTPVPVVICIVVIPHRYSYIMPARDNFPVIFTIFVSGILVMLFGETIRVVAVAYSSPATRTRNVGASRLFSSGPFAHVRNPLYIGNSFILFGMLIMSWTCFPWLLMVSVFLFCFQYYFIVKLEEEALIRDLKEEYIEYKKHVPCFLPRMSPYNNDSKRKPDYKEAFKSERNSFNAEIILIILILIRWYLIMS